MNEASAKAVIEKYQERSPVTSQICMTGRPSGNPTLVIHGLDLFLTCGACPEQYEVFLGEQQVGYLRLRHGWFRVDVPACNGETIYEAFPKGDGIFERSERMDYLEAAVAAIYGYFDGMEA